MAYQLGSEMQEPYNAFVVALLAHASTGDMDY
jgi:hypothetical protein